MKSLRVYTVCAGLLIASFLAWNISSAQEMRTLASKHVLLQFPPERDLQGRELSAEVERCYDFMNRSINDSLPRNITVALDWSASESASNFRTGRVTVGLNRPAAGGEIKGSQIHEIARSIAQLGLNNLSQGSLREDTEFLFEGMMEILAHEYDHSSRSLDTAWATARLLDEMGALGIAHQRVWSEFSGGKRSHRNAAPGITFFLMVRDLYDRSRPVKFFETLRKNSLLNGLSATFRRPVAELEAAWLKKARAYEIPEEITIRAGGVPQLKKSNAEAVRPGENAKISLFIEDPDNDLYPESVFVRDRRSGKTFQSTIENESFTVTIPVPPDCPAGQYSWQAIAIDETGNLRSWTGTYSVN